MPEVSAVHAVCSLWNQPLTGGKSPREGAKWRGTVSLARGCPGLKRQQKTRRRWLESCLRTPLRVAETLPSRKEFSPVARASSLGADRSNARGHCVLALMK